MPPSRTKEAEDDLDFKESEAMDLDPCFGRFSSRILILVLPKPYETFPQA
jgi:hypothetical protein